MENIKKQVKGKVEELSYWEQVRWEGGRLYYECNKIINEINIYDIETQIFYLELLLEKHFILQDNTPFDAPDITFSFRNWLKTSINKKKGWLLTVKDNTIKKSDFLNTFIQGIHELQMQGDKNECIIKIKNGICQEQPFQYYFKTFFASKYDSVEAETQKGNGRIDLKVKDKRIGIKIIEFKGWWNYDKKNLIAQIVEYLTDFEKEGYIFMINHNKRKKIVDNYKKEIITDKMNYVRDSWKTNKYNNSNFEYYLSKHNIKTREKLLYHFIFNVY